MLDYSTNLSDQGIVRFLRRAAHYVPRKPGVYRILAVPYSYAADDLLGTAKTYVSAFDAFRLDVRDKVNAKLESDGKQPRLRIEKVSKWGSLSATDSPSHMILRFAPMFPPIYVGKATVLRDRFLDHDRGTNSNVRSDMTKFGLSEHVAFFHWQLCRSADLDVVESLLIRAHYPILNRQLR